MKLIRESIAEDKGTSEIFIDGEPWYIKKIDSTHFYMANNESSFKTGAAWAWHIGEFKDRNFYEDLRQWLHGGPNPEGKKY